jgi:hypothetical protein
LSKQFDELSKDLANGVSRRSAFRRFFVGISTAAGVFLSGKSARADTGNFCVDYCQSLYEKEPFAFAQCLVYSLFCPKGECATLLTVNGGAGVGGRYFCTTPCPPITINTTAVIGCLEKID